MNEPLIAALENRISLGEDKESLRSEVVSHGHTNEEFEAAFAEAARRIANTAEPQGADTTKTPSAPTADLDEAQPAQPVAMGHSRARGDIHTLTVGSPSPTKLIGYIEMFRVGWQIGNASLGSIGGLLGSILLLIPIIFTVIFAAGMLIATVEPTSVASIALLFVAGALAYLALFVYVTAAGFAFFRAIVRRDEEEVAFWPHFGWAMRHIIPLFLLSFYLQIINQAGFALLVIPGILTSIYLGYAVFVFADEGTKGFDAMIRSFELVYGRFWSVLGRKLFILVVVFFSMILIALMLAIVPPLGLMMLLFMLVGLYFIFCATVALYESLQQQAPVHVFTESERATIKVWLRIIVVAALLLATYSLYSGLVSYDDSEGPSEYQMILNELFGEEYRDSTEDWLDASGSEANDAIETNSIKQHLLGAQTRAEMYHFDNGGSYAGVCSSPAGINTNMRYAYDAGSDDVFCHDTSEWYMAEAELLDSGRYFCIDSFGNAVENSYTREGFESCLPEEPLSDLFEDDAPEEDEEGEWMPSGAGFVPAEEPAPTEAFGGVSA